MTAKTDPNGASGRHGAGPSVVVEFEADASAPSRARDLVRQVGEDLPAELIDRATLVVSELVTNAVVHTESRAEQRLITVTVEVTHAPDRLTLAVTDAGGRPVGRRRRRGYGLSIVASQADRWHAYRRSAGWQVVCTFTPR